MPARFVLAGMALASTLVVGCSRARPPTTQSFAAPRAYWVQTGNTTIDYWNHVNRACYGHQQLATNPKLEENFCRTQARLIREGLTTGVDPELLAWAEKLAKWYEIKAQILQIRNDPDFYPHGLRDKQAGISPDHVEENEQLLVDWGVGFQQLRAEGLRLRDTLSMRLGQPLLPCVLDASR